MAKDTREILSAIRLETQTIEGPNVTTSAKVYGVDDKDELAQVATPDQLAQWLKSGAITGDWGLPEQTMEEPGPPAAPEDPPRNSRR